MRKIILLLLVVFVIAVWRRTGTMREEGTIQDNFDFSLSWLNPNCLFRKTRKEHTAFCPLSTQYCHRHPRRHIETRETSAKFKNLVSQRECHIVYGKEMLWMQYLSGNSWQSSNRRHSHDGNGDGDAICIVLIPSSFVLALFNLCPGIFHGRS